jgi:hypothetical protein
LVFQRKITRDVVKKEKEARKGPFILTWFYAVCSHQKNWLGRIFIGLALFLPPPKKRVAFEKAPQNFCLEKKILKDAKIGIPVVSPFKRIKVNFILKKSAKSTGFW